MAVIKYALDGVAIGGPRTGVRLTASPNWSGRVRYAGRTRDHTPHYYPGNYVWNAALNTWVWVALPAKAPAKRASKRVPRTDYV